MSERLQVQWLGRVSFADALARQEELVGAKRLEPSLPDHLLLLEHDAVYQLGIRRTAREQAVRCGVSTSLAFGGNDSALVMRVV